VPLTHEQQVARAAVKAARARHDLHAAIRAARDAGLSLRAIADAADLSPEWVRRIANAS
jgi:hypothetical protein